MLDTSSRSWQGRPLSGWWRRVGAELIDELLLTAIALSIFLAVGFPFGEWLDQGNLVIPTGLDLLFLGLYFVLSLVYFIPVMSLTDGRTLGKWALGIRTVRATLTPMNPSVAGLREGLLKSGILSLLWPLFFVSVLWPLGDPQNRALHDLVAGTRVIRDRGELEKAGAPDGARP